MIAQLFSIGFVMLLSAMLPGPDFAIVTKNTLLHSRRAGIFTTVGITAAIAIHMTYCLLGLAIVIAHSLWLFNAIKLIGAAYLIYLGIKSLLSKPTSAPSIAARTQHKKDISIGTAFRQGFLCNLLNPK